MRKNLFILLCCLAGINVQCQNTKKMKLIYVIDPLCGWCYGNTINTGKLYAELGKEIEFEILPAGMWTGAGAKKQDAALASYVSKSDKRIAELTGTPFGEAYFKLVKDETIILDSELPSRAIVCIKEIAPEKAVPFAIEVQRARYFYGKDLNKEQTYLSICDALQIDPKVFSSKFSSIEIKQKTQECFVKASKLAQSYPTLLVEKGGKYYIVEQGFAAYQDIISAINQLNK